MDIQNRNTLNSHILFQNVVTNLCKALECSFDPSIQEYFYHLDCSERSLSLLVSLEILKKKGLFKIKTI